MKSPKHRFIHMVLIKLSSSKTINIKTWMWENNLLGGEELMKMGQRLELGRKSNKNSLQIHIKMSKEYI